MTLWLCVGHAYAQSPPPAPSGVSRVTLVYTGRSLGALGVLQDAQEHELLIEEAARAKAPLRVATFRCWRAPNVTLFSGDADLDAADLSAFLATRPSAVAPGEPRPSLRSNNVTMVQEPTSASDLLALVLGNARSSSDFPDLVPATLTLGHAVGAGGRQLWLAIEANSDSTAGAVWPADPAGWTMGQMERLEMGGAVLFELAVNLAQIGPRATIVGRATADASARGSRPIVIDLGERDGDLGLERADRARVDYTALSRLGYSLVVPYELELGLGAAGLATLQKDFASIQFLAANLKAKAGTATWSSHQIIDVDGIKIGFFGIVDPEVEGVLAKSALATYTFESPLVAAARETAALRSEGADAVVMLSNLHPKDNAAVARELTGIDAIVADLHVRWSPEDVATTVRLAQRSRSRAGSPALVARSLANGLGVGTLDLEFTRRAGMRPFLTSLSHVLQSATDRTPADAALVADVRRLADAAERPRGPMLLPSFSEMVAARPVLSAYDATTALGRISKRLWEEFLARLLRRQAGTETAIIRKLAYFPPAIGDLHESDVRAWLWTEDTVVTLDLTGADLRKILAEDTKNELVVSGLDRLSLMINGRALADDTSYRVATTDLLLEGARFRSFDNARRTLRAFHVRDDGTIHGEAHGSVLTLRDFVLQELTRFQARDARDAYVERLAQLFDKDPPFERLYTVRFDHPSVFGSINQAYRNAAYGSVPESRVSASNSSIVGLTGRYVLSLDLPHVGLDFGALTSFARQSADAGPGQGRLISEAADDLKFDVTARRKAAATTRWRPEPFLRSVYDTEFTPTVNPANGVINPRERLIRGIGGVSLTPGPHWARLEVGVVLQDDLGAHHLEPGAEIGAEFRHAFGAAGGCTYRLVSQLDYFFPAKNDTAANLAIRYDMLHEISIPLVQELSLTIGADIFVFKGKVAATRLPGASAILRIGLTYDRLWKPRYQPFF